MPNINVRVNSALCGMLGFHPAEFEDMNIPVGENQSILETVRLLAEEDGPLWKIIFDEKNRIINPGVLLILNGRIANPYDPKVILGEGDRLTFLPMMEGG